MIDLRGFLESVESIVGAHNLGRPGAYARWSWQDDSDGRNLGINPYDSRGIASGSAGRRSPTSPTPTPDT